MARAIHAIVTTIFVGDRCTTIATVRSSEDHNQSVSVRHAESVNAALETYIARKPGKAT